MSYNQNLHEAQRAGQDEFYTQLSDIENELKHYKAHFKNKVVYCNCDDPRVSNFFHYFSYNFQHLGLKKLITTCYKNSQDDMFSKHDSESAIMLEYDGFCKGDTIPNVEDIGILKLRGDGDFRSDECIRLLKQADIVVTNPPFSLFREYVAQLVEHDKKFIIIGNKNAIIYIGIFPLIRENRIWVGHTPMGRDLLFDLPPDYTAQLLAKGKRGSAYRIVDGVVKGRSQSIWYTNLDHKKRHEKLYLSERYDPEVHPKYENYDAIEVSNIAKIPMDFDGIMGVPVSFMDKYNPEQFELLGSNRGIEQDPNGIYGRGSYLNGKETYKRIFIRNRRPRQ